MKLVKGEVVEVKQRKGASASFHLKTGEVSIMSLLVGSTSPGYKPVDIMHWCQGYGDKATVAEWLRPSTWIKARLPKRSIPKESPPRPRDQ